MGAVVLAMLSLHAELRMVGSKDCRAVGVTTTGSSCLFAALGLRALYPTSRTSKAPVASVVSVTAEVAVASTIGVVIIVTPAEGTVSVTKNVTVTTAVSMSLVGRVVKAILAVTFELIVAVASEAVKPSKLLQNSV